METDFAISMTVEMKREASEICTLGESIARENLEKGIVKGRTEGQYAIVKRMLKHGRSFQEVVEDTGESEAGKRKVDNENRRLESACSFLGINLG